MIGHLGLHGADDGDVVDVCGGFGKEFADFDSGLPVGSKAERRREGGTGFAFGQQVVGDCAVAEAGESWFGIERIDV